MKIKIHLKGRPKGLGDREFPGTASLDAYLAKCRADTMVRVSLWDNGRKLADSNVHVSKEAAMYFVVKFMRNTHANIKQGENQGERAVRLWDEPEFRP